MTLPSQAAKRQASDNINQHKSRLIDVLRKLEGTPGCAAAAKDLGRIIGRLESWQAQHAGR